MPSHPTSTTAQRRLDDAIEVLIAIAAEYRGVDLTRRGPSAVEVTVGTAVWSATVITRDAVSLADARTFAEECAPGAWIIAAQQLSADAKDFFATRNALDPVRQFSWLDRRGELALHHGGAVGVVHFGNRTARERSPLPGGWRLAAPISGGPIRGRAGIGCAAALLLTPEHPPSIREIARRITMSHGAVGAASQLLREHGLVRSDGRPQIPELFEAVVKVWHPRRVTPVRELPSEAGADRLGAFADGDEPGWCVGGDTAAFAWGAPVMSGGSRPWIWVPETADARRAERALEAGTWDDYAAVVAVAPTPLVCRERRQPPRPVNPAFLPTAHPVFLALDLAQDPSRGREILDQWTPTQPGIARVW
ncbi:MAG: hypothetical protein JJE46_10795 [Acidimicrobiia bacterium]|nr:hypothetical protein [Acidimicrobiia bacterium]